LLCFVRCLTVHTSDKKVVGVFVRFRAPASLVYDEGIDEQVEFGALKLGDTSTRRQSV
jgi:hypothetical protein